MLRVIARRPPVPEAVAVSPCLEDVYLFWFGEAGRERGESGFVPKCCRGGKKG